MAIDNINEFLSSVRSRVKHATAPTGIDLSPATGPGAALGIPTETVTLSSEANKLRLAQEKSIECNTPFNEEKVQRICAALAEGKYSLNAEKIALSLIEEVRARLLIENKG